MPLADMPAAADAIGMKTPSNAKSPCYTCNIQREYRQNHYYIPYTKYSLGSLPTQMKLQTTISNIEKANNDAIHTNYGVTHSSILLKLQLIHFPQSFPANIMHYVLQNICPMLFGLWAKKFLKNDNADNY